MARPCSVCRRKDRAAIDAELVRGTPLLRLQGQFGVNRKQLGHHRDVCIASKARAAREAQLAVEVQEGGDLRAQAHKLYQRALGWLDEAEKLCGAGVPQQSKKRRGKAPPTDDVQPSQEATAGAVPALDMRALASVAQLLGKAKDCLELVARLEGLLSTGPAVTVVFQSEEAKLFTQAILRHTQAVLLERLGDEAAAGAAAADLARRIEAERMAAAALVPGKGQPAMLG